MSEVLALAVDFVTSVRDIPETLWQCCFPPPLEGRWWYATLERSGLERQFDIFYAVLRRGAEPVGIAPLFAMQLRLEFLVPERLRFVVGWLGGLVPSLSRPRILFVGSPCAEEGAVGLLPGVARRAAFAALQRALDDEAARRRASVIAWKDFPASYDDDLAAIAADNGMFRMTSFPGTLIAPLPPTEDAYFAGLKATRRRNLRKKLRLSHDALVADVSVIQDPDAATLDQIFALFQQTYARADVSLERLDRRFFEAIAQQPVAHFVLLRERASGTLVAFMLCFDIGGHVINKYIGIDYTRPKGWFLFFRLFEAGLQWAIARGASAFQSGQTGYSGKLECGHRLIPLSILAKHRNRLLHRIGGAVARRINWSTLDPDLAVYLKAHPEGEAQAGRGG